MGYQSKTYEDQFRMSRTLIAILAITLALPAWAECDLKEDSVVTNTVKILEKEIVSRAVTPNSRGRSCGVDARFRVGSEWHVQAGDADWQENETIQQTCARAMDMAERSLTERIGRANIQSRKLVVCRDDGNYRRLDNYEVGTVRQLHQYRPHPTYPKSFVHNGTQCRFFLDTKMQEKDIYTYQGVICEIGRDQWAVVDKF
jgi:hypothetical protein